MDLRKIIKKHEAFLGTEFHVYFTPGRVNLIGEHIDYQGGTVFPISIDLGIYAFVSKREDFEFHFLSDNFSDFGVKVIKYKNVPLEKSDEGKKIKSEDSFSNSKNDEFSDMVKKKMDFRSDVYFNQFLDSEIDTNVDLNFNPSENWINFPKGIISYFLKIGIHFPKGLNILIYGDLPKAAGLSSSASLEVLISLVLKYEYHLNVDLIEIAKIAQFVENRYLGIKCGIMDQFTVAMSKKNCALYLNTSTLDYDYIPLNLGEYSLVVANTNRSRVLSDSKYNERIEECLSGLSVINKNIRKVDFISDIDSTEFLQNKHVFSNQIVSKRVEHIVYENERTKAAKEALIGNDLISFGNLMNRSHDSLRYLYEVSCFELDTLVKSFRKHGAIGSRMTGAGFGGCTVSLVKTEQINDIILKVKQDYFDKIGYHASFYSVKACDGARKIESEDIL